MSFSLAAAIDQMTKTAAEYQGRWICAAYCRVWDVVKSERNTAEQQKTLEYKDLKTLALFLPSALSMQSHEANGSVLVQLRAPFCLKISAGTILDLHTLSLRRFLMRCLTPTSKVGFSVYPMNQTERNFQRGVAWSCFSLYQYHPWGEVKGTGRPYTVPHTYRHATKLFVCLFI